MKKQKKNQFNFHRINKVVNLFLSIKLLWTFNVADLGVQFFTHFKEEICCNENADQTTCTFKIEIKMYRFL